MSLGARIKSLTRRAISSAAFWSGYCLVAESLGIGRGARILVYHGINDSPTSPYAVSARDFAFQMRFLAEQCRPVSVHSLVELLRRGRPIPPRTVAVTIDDGYSDAYTHAYPILRRFAIPATVFLPVDLIGAGSSGTATSRLPQTEFLLWSQVREMSRSGIDFGSHTLTHVSLTEPARQDIREQLEKSKARLEEEIGQPVTGFAYPYGTYRDFNPEIAQLVTATGYSWAVTGISGANDHRCDLFALRRTRVERDDGMVVFQRALRGALDPWIVMQRLGSFM